MLQGDDDPAGALARGIISGLVAFVFLWRIVRYDARTVPALLATGLLLDGAQNAALAGTTNAWVLFAVGAAFTVAVAWATTRYIAQPLLPHPPA